MGLWLKTSYLVSFLKDKIANNDDCPSLSLALTYPKLISNCNLLFPDMENEKKSNLYVNISSNSVTN